MQAFIHGVILAFGLILPLGIQNVFVFNQGASQPRFVKALPVIITAALCDTFLIILAVLGVSLIVLGIHWVKTVLLCLGTVFIIYMGFITWRSSSHTIHGDNKPMTFKKQIVFSASVSLLNPHAILDTIGVIGTSSLNYNNNALIQFTSACILVSWLWFFTLAIVGWKLGRLNQSNRFIVMLNKVSAIIMWFTAIYLMLSLIESIG
jgi:L-lysine exporter family protein LysE/ArgO